MTFVGFALRTSHSSKNLGQKPPLIRSPRSLVRGTNTDTRRTAQPHSTAEALGREV
jgi:hypothetical protein